MANVTRSKREQPREGKTSAPTFASQRDFNQFYAGHCWECRNPLAPHTARACLRTWEESPDVGFMMYCDDCKSRLEKRHGRRRSVTIR